MNNNLSVSTSFNFQPHINELELSIKTYDQSAIRPVKHQGVKDRFFKLFSKHRPLDPAGKIHQDLIALYEKLRAATEKVAELKDSPPGFEKAQKLGAATLEQRDRDLKIAETHLLVLEKQLTEIKNDARLAKLPGRSKRFAKLEGALKTLVGRISSVHGETIENLKWLQAKFEVELRHVPMSVQERFYQVTGNQKLNLNDKKLVLNYLSLEEQADRLLQNAKVKPIQIKKLQTELAGLAETFQQTALLADLNIAASVKILEERLNRMFVEASLSDLEMRVQATESLSDQPLEEEVMKVASEITALREFEIEDEAFKEHLEGRLKLLERNVLSLLNSLLDLYESDLKEMLPTTLQKASPEVQRRFEEAISRGVPKIQSRFLVLKYLNMEEAAQEKLKTGWQSEHGISEEVKGEVESLQHVRRRMDKIDPSFAPTFDQWVREQKIGLENLGTRFASNPDYRRAKIADNIARLEGHLAKTFPLSPDMVQILKISMEHPRTNEKIEKLIEKLSTHGFSLEDVYVLQAALAPPSDEWLALASHEYGLSEQAAYSLLNHARRDLSAAIDRQFKVELAQAPKKIKALFSSLQDIVGKNFVIPSLFKSALLRALNRPELQRNFDAVLKEAQRVKEKCVRELARQTPIEIENAFSELFQEKISIPVLEKLHRDEDYRVLEELNLLLACKIGAAMNTQMLTDLMPLALRSREELSSLRGGAERGKKFFEARQEIPHDHLSPRLQALIADGYIEHPGYNLWLKNEWQETDQAIRWTGHFVSSKEDSSQLNKTTGGASINLSKLGVGDHQERVAILDVVTDWCNSEPSKRQEVLRGIKERDFRYIPQSMLLVLNPDPAVWRRVNRNPGPSGEQKGLFISANVLRDMWERCAYVAEAAEAFRQASERSMIAAYMHLGAA